MRAERFAIIIPARFASTRFPAKPLAPLRGATGIAKTLIQRSWECARSIEGSVGLWVATDDERIAEEVRRFGGQVVMTSPDCENGTARCADAIDQLGDVADIIVNLQGDAPLSPTFVVQRLVDRLASNGNDAVMATPAVRCSRSVYDHLLKDQADGKVGGTTVVFDRNHRALYFSKTVIPHLPESMAQEERPPVHLHLGLYAYRPEALRKYSAAEPSEVELLEGLEQLRFLDLGLPVAIEQLDPLEWDSIELNNPSDVPVIERILSERGIS